MAKYCGGAAVGVADRGADAVDLVLAGLAPHLQRRLGEAQHARTRRSGSTTARRRSTLTGQLAADLGLALLGQLPAVAQRRRSPRFSIHIGSYQLNGT